MPRTRYWIGRALSSLVDPTIVLSFDRIGYLVHALTFDESELDVDLTGKRCAVTGATSGLGFETAMGLAERGAEVLLLCRDEVRGADAATKIAERTGSSNLHVEKVDVASLRSIHDLAQRLEGSVLDVLVHNAGVLPAERMESPDGIELTLATHVIGPHLLTKLLRRNLERAVDARVIWVSSGGMYTRALQLNDHDWQQRRYDGVIAYAETKRAQVVLAERWAEELASAGVTVNAMHPGWADTPGVRSSLPVFRRVMRRVLRTPMEGADTIVWLAACPRARQSTGDFFFDRQKRRTHLLPFTRESADDRRRLWDLCERPSAPSLR